MKTNKKMNFTRQRKSSLVKRITLILYILFVILSIARHNISDLSSFVQEIIAYILLGSMLYITPKMVSIDELKGLFD